MNDVGLWVGFLFSLLIFSSLAGDHALARLAQHVLVGAALGYAGLLAVREVLQPRLFALLLQGEAAGQWLWVPLLLGLLLLVAGIDYLLGQGNAPADQFPGWRRLLRSLGLLPVALMLGVGVSVAVIGVVQGTLLPQVWRAVGGGTEFAQPTADGMTQALTLLLTTATLLQLTVNVDRPLARQPALVRNVFQIWLWVGKRALWIAAGVIFARLAAARLSLLISRFEYFRATLAQTGIWDFVESIWRGLSNYR